MGSSDGKLYQIGVATRTVTSVTIGDGSAPVGAPSLDIANNMVYVGSVSGIVYAVLLPTPRRDSPALPPGSRWHRGDDSIERDDLAAIDE